ncbi:MAG: type IV toxin-antitoxin system AbiEi family antitoxin [Bacteroidota bacterium]|nr:type IV toxin-antitoxin system AbiEi family antitoxin [Bacteroidota bacterium]
MKDNFIHTAINEILKEHKVNAIWKELVKQDIDGVIKLNYKGHAQEFFVEIKKELREYQLPNIFKLNEAYDPIMVIAEKLFPKIKDTLIEQGIAYIEMNGNINIETDNILLKVEGKQKQYLQQEKYGRAFTKAGLKALLLFLTNENDINDTYREIAKNAGIALGNVKLILEGLVEEGFALKVNEKELKLTNKDQLLQKWCTAYTEKLKPALKVGNFRFNNPNVVLEWKKIKLKKTQTQWGGEPAGNIYTKYLQPEYLTIYTNEKKANLIKNYRLIPDMDGNVMVYEKFWEEKEPYRNVVPPVIAYADLLATGKKRCIETAQKIYEQLIENTL